MWSSIITGRVSWKTGKNIIFKALICFLVLSLLPSFVYADVIYDTECVIDNTAHNWNTAPWDQSKEITYNGYQYTAYWDSDYNLVFARRKLSDNTVQTIQFTDVVSDPNNAHRSTAIGISPANGRIHIAYGNHSDPLNYRYSNVNFITNPPAAISSSDFSAKTSMLSNPALENDVTYTRFFNDNSNNLYCIYRMGVSGIGDGFLQKYNSSTSTWSRVGKVFTSEGTYVTPWGDSTSRNAYLHDILFDTNDRLHVTWVYRENQNKTDYNTNHGLYYAYSDDYGITWRNNNGTVIANLNNNDPISVSDTGIMVVSVPCNLWIINQGTMYVDSNNQPHIFTQCGTVVTEDRAIRNIHLVHYWRSTNGTWNSQYIDDTSIPNFSTGRGDIVMDSSDNIYLLFNAKTSNLENYYYLYCAQASAADNWNTWKIYSLLDVLVTGEGKYDRSRWESSNIITFAESQPSGNDTKFVLKDFVLGARTVPAAPQLSAVQDMQGIMLTWLPSKGAEKYDIYRKPSGGSYSLLASNVSDKSVVTYYLDNGVTVGTTYDYKINAKNEAGTSVDSNEVSVLAGSGGYRKFWGFDTAGNFEGWTLDKNLTGTVSSGKLNLTITGTDPYMKSSPGIYIDTSKYKYIKIRMKNNTLDTSASLYWITNSDMVWGSDKMVSFPITANDTGYTEYLINLYSNAEWSGIVKQIRIDPADTAGSGTVNIDYIAYSAFGRQWEYNVDDFMDDWTINSYLTGSVSNGTLNLTITGTDPQIKSFSGLGIPAEDYDLVQIGMKNNTSDISAKLYWITDADQTWNESKCIPFTINANDSSYTNYTLDLHNHSYWIGTIRQLRLDPVNNGSLGSANIDYIRLCRGHSSRWYFDSEGNFEGWTLDKNLTGTVSSGKLDITVTGTDPYMKSPAGLGIDTKSSKKVRIKMKNNTSDNTAQLYWIRDTDPRWSGTMSAAFEIVPNDTMYREYVIDVSGNSEWFNKINQIRLDPVNSAGSGMVSIEYIKITDY